MKAVATATSTAVANEPVLFKTQAAWSTWLSRNHASSAGVWMRIARTGAEVSSVTYPQALEEALRYGWIDGIKKSEDAQHWLQRFTPRSARSIWSKVNRDKALALIAGGKMQPSGLKEVERAQADGRWERAYDCVSASTVPDDLQAAFSKNKKAAAFFATLDSRNRYAVLFRIQTAKKPETRGRRIADFVAMLARGEKVHP